MDYIFQLIFTNLIGNNIYYLLRKLVGDKRTYKEIINNEKDSTIRFLTGTFTLVALVVFLVKSTS